MRLKLFAVILLIAVQFVEAAHYAHAHHVHSSDCPACVADLQHGSADSADIELPRPQRGEIQAFESPRIPCSSLIPRFRKNRSPPLFV